MKRLICLLIALAMVCTLAACGETQERKYTFYYLRSPSTIQYGQPDGLVAPVDRDLSTSNLSLEDLLRLYLAGPANEAYVSPIPKNTHLLTTISRDDELMIVLSREFSTLDGVDLSLAGACLSATCHSLTGMDRIQVRSGEGIYHFDYHSYVFLDDSAGN